MEENNKKMFSRGETLLWIVITAATVFVATSMQYTRMTLGSEEYAVESNNSGDKFKKLERVLDVVEQNFLFEYDMEKLEEGAIRGLVEALGDPYTDYFNVSESEEFLQETEGEYEGVGIYMALDTSKDMVIVLMPIKGSPAEEAGILPGDYIVQVDDKDVKGVSTEEIASLIKGKKETTVTVTFRRYKEDGTYEEFEKGIATLKDFCLLRAESVKGQLNGTIGSTTDTQKTETLIDAESININDMGSMGNMGDGRDKLNGKIETPKTAIGEVIGARCEIKTNTGNIKFVN
jgi:carboxyl-terminal processing protease